MSSTEWLLFLLILSANGVPILTRHAVPAAWMKPIDNGRLFFDGKPLLGTSKTIVGLLAAMSITTLLAALMGLAWQTGLTIGSFAMLGDLFASFIKRRIGLPSSAMAPLLDQVPEALFPLLAYSLIEDINWSAVLIITVAFVIADLLMSRLAFHLGIRNHPY
jgi:CDP-diglyceride synthetase